MLRIAIVRKGQPADRRTCANGADLLDVIHEVIRAEGSEAPAADTPGTVRLLADIRRMVDTEGFAALEFGATALTIRPAA